MRSLPLYGLVAALLLVALSAFPHLHLGGTVAIALLGACLLAWGRRSGRLWIRFGIIWLGACWLACGWSHFPTPWIQLLVTGLCAVAAVSSWLLYTQSATRQGIQLASVAVLTGLGVSIVVYLSDSLAALVFSPAALPDGPGEPVVQIICMTCIAVVFVLTPVLPSWIPRLTGAWALSGVCWALVLIAPELFALGQGWRLLHQKQYRAASDCFVLKESTICGRGGFAEALRLQGMARAKYGLGDTEQALRYWRRIDPRSVQRPEFIQSEFESVLAGGGHIDLATASCVAMEFSSEGRRLLVLMRTGDMFEVSKQTRLLGTLRSPENAGTAVDFELLPDDKVAVLWENGLLTIHASHDLTLVYVQEAFRCNDANLVFQPMDLEVEPARVSGSTFYLHLLDLYGGWWTDGPMPMSMLTAGLHGFLHNGTGWRGGAVRLLAGGRAGEYFLGYQTGQVYPVEAIQREDGRWEVMAFDYLPLGGADLAWPDQAVDFLVFPGRTPGALALWKDGTVQPMGNVPFGRAGLISPRLRSDDQAVDLEVLPGTDWLFYLTSQGYIYTNVGPHADVFASTEWR